MARVSSGDASSLEGGSDALVAFSKTPFGWGSGRVATGASLLRARQLNRSGSKGKTPDVGHNAGDWFRPFRLREIIGDPLPGPPLSRACGIAPTPAITLRAFSPDPMPVNPKLGSVEIETSGWQAAAEKRKSGKMWTTWLKQNLQRLARRWFGIAPRPRADKLHRTFRKMVLSFGIAGSCSTPSPFRYLCPCDKARKRLRYLPIAGSV